MSDAQILRTVLDLWKSAVDAHEPDRVAAYFTDDAIFQGLHPYAVGRAGVAAYYAAQPLGLTAAYDIRESPLADDLVLGYLEVEFGFTDRPALTVHLGVLLRRIDDDWLIGHYQVSRLDLTGWSCGGGRRSLVRPYRAPQLHDRRERRPRPVSELVGAEGVTAWRGRRSRSRW